MADADDTLFSRIGGSETIGRLVEDFYRRMDALDDAKGIRAMHPADLTSTKQVLKRYLIEWTGGPKLYTPEKGHPRLRQRHMGARIGDSERDAWLMCMRGALAATVTDESARADLDAALSKLADWMRNQPG
jgi:hemoglobin